MVMPRKPEGLKKIGVSVGLTPAIIAAIDEALEPGQSRSNWVALAIHNQLKTQGIKHQKKIKN